MQFPTGSHHPPRSHENPRCNSQAKGIQSKSKCLAEKIVSFAETEGLEPQTHDSLFLFQDVFFKASSCQFPILPKKAGCFLLKKKTTMLGYQTDIELSKAANTHWGHPYKARMAFFRIVASIQWHPNCQHERRMRRPRINRGVQQGVPEKYRAKVVRKGQKIKKLGVSKN